LTTGIQRRSQSFLRLTTPGAPGGLTKGAGQI
jgi:hypothetical protein